jgi:hypothetical protein
MVVIRDLKTRYMLWPGIKYTMYSLYSKSDWIIFIPRSVKAGIYIYIYIYISGLISIGKNRQAKLNVVIRDLKSR